MQSISYKRNSSNLAIALLCLVLNPFLNSTKAQTNQSDILDLAGILQLAEKNSALLLSLNSDLEALFYKKRQEGRTQNPSLTIDYGIRSAINQSGAEYSLQLDQPIFYPGRKELRQLLVDNDAKIKEIQLVEATNSIRLSSIKYAYRYVVAAEKKNHVKERLKRLSLIESYIRARPFITPQAKADLFIIDRKILSLKKHFNDLELGSEKDYESMNLYLMRENPPNLRIPYYKDGIQFEYDRLLKKAVLENPTILAAVGEVERAKTELLLANMEKYPDYSVMGQVGEDKSGVANRFYDFGLRFRIPVWDQYENKVSTSRANFRSKQDRVTHQENLIKIEFKKAFLDYEKSKANLKLFTLSKLNEVEKDLNYADVEFKKGRILLMTYLELENQLHETHHAILDAQLSHVESLLNLLYITNEKDILGNLKNAVEASEYQSK
ncbi:hypothetical protein CH373_06520 [Leptospira perolatii]|uniref:Channel protein TolC n=1 Tax=Leptospira perolatii TaxID=2023191 RepID=A0A2M9ZNZ8_9LEPT|nr:TolC family protein [Leptospira perolatii]PJZ70596.1 hypothetical protein CH360_03380 [Leptospira perolatii]PJZ73808.1 hypothetical protein CH373_06520 [Leptospira perolatii]